MPVLGDAGRILAFAVLAAAPAAASGAYGQPTVWAQLGLNNPAEDVRMGSTGPGAEVFMRAMWGSDKWPPKDALRRPPEENQGIAGAPWDLQLSMLCLVGLAALSVYGGRVTTSLKTVRPLGSPAVPEGVVQDLERFGLHFRALSSAICWRHLHRRAWLLHLFRVALPVVCLFMVFKMRTALANFLNKDEEAALQGMTGSTTEGVVMGVVEYSLSVTMVYVVMLSMVFFVWHVTAESSSGFRHLLHVSGLSRPAYMLATAGVDGLAFSLAALVVMLVVSGFVIQVRMVLWTSPILLISVLFLLSFSAISTGYILALLCPSPRLASTAAQIVMLLVVIGAPFAPMSAVVPAAGEYSWTKLLLPTIPAYRMLFELVAGCVKGRCLTLSDVSAAAGGVATPWAVAFGSPSPAKDFTPPEILCTFFILVVIQLKLSWAFIYWLDRRQNQPLHDSGISKGRGQRQTAAGAVLEVKHLVHRYGFLQTVTGSPTNNVLNDVSFSVLPGTMLGLLGPNGSGKTTTIRCITGEERACEGTVAINVEGRAANVGLCPQETCVNGDLTVEENLRFFAFLRDATGPEADRCVERILAAMRLKEKRDWMPDTLSGGMRRRLAVGCAMIGMPAVTILDEPTTGLDPMTRRGIWTTIQEIMSSGGCCLLTTHMLEEAEELCNQLVILASGRKVAEGTVQQLKTQFGTGYLLSLDSNEGESGKTKDFIEGMLPASEYAIVKTTDKGQMTYRLKTDEEALGNLIINIARHRTESGIKHWGISQASLEDAYVQIINQETAQLEPTEP